MTKRALGPGAVCCGDPEACDVGCFAQPATALPDLELFDLDTVADELELDLSDEEVDE